MQLKLIQLTGEDEGREFELPEKGLIRLGSASLNEVVLSEKGVANFHSQIRLENNKYIISNLGSPSGVIVNGKKINEIALNAGDIIELGEAKLKVGKNIEEDDDFDSRAYSSSKESKKDADKQPLGFNFWANLSNAWRVSLIVLTLIFAALLIYAIYLWKEL